MNHLASFLLRLVLGVAGLVFALSLIVAALIFGLFLLLRAVLTGKRPQVFAAWEQARSAVRRPDWTPGGRRGHRDAGDVIDVEVRESGRAGGESPRLPPS